MSSLILDKMHPYPVYNLPPGQQKFYERDPEIPSKEHRKEMLRPRDRQRHGRGPQRHYEKDNCFLCFQNCKNNTIYHAHILLPGNYILHILLEHNGKHK